MIIRHVLVVLTAALAAAATHAAPPEVPKTLNAKQGQMVRVLVKADKGLGYATNFDDDEAFFEELPAKNPGERRYVFQAPDDPAVKTDRIYVVTFWTEGEKSGRCVTITVSPKSVDPLPPVPVQPPPNPVPVPSPKEDAKAGNPFKTKSLRVMLVYDPTATFTEEQKAVVFSQPIREYIISKSSTPPERQDVGRFWPKTTDSTNATDEWKAAYQRAKDKMNDAPMWLIVSGGGVWQEGPAPPTQDAMLTLLKKYGGSP